MQKVNAFANKKDNYILRSYIIHVCYFK